MCTGGGVIGLTVPHAQIILTIHIYIIDSERKGVGVAKQQPRNNIMIWECKKDRDKQQRNTVDAVMNNLQTRVGNEKKT